MLHQISSCAFNCLWERIYLPSKSFLSWWLFILFSFLFEKDASHAQTFETQVESDSTWRILSRRFQKLLLSPQQMEHCKNDTFPFANLLVYLTRNVPIWLAHSDGREQPWKKFKGRKLVSWRTSFTRRWHYT